MANTLVREKADKTLKETFHKGFEDIGATAGFKASLGTGGLGRGADAIAGTGGLGADGIDGIDGIEGGAT